MEMKVRLTVNGQEKTITTDSRRSLLDVLREDLGLTGAKYACGEGRCGACSVLMDGKRVLSCVTPVSRADKKTIVTIEGLAKDDVLHPVQEAFLQESAMQCGYCISGVLMSAAALLIQNPDPSETDVRVALDRNLCRCGSHNRIVRAVLKAAREARQS